MKTTTNISPDLEKPANLSPEGNKAYRAIMAFLKEKDLMYTGGCKAFYSPKEWRQRGESYGDGSELVIVHDGGDLSFVFNADKECYKLVDSMNKIIDSLGLYVQPLTCWSTAIYKR